MVTPIDLDALERALDKAEELPFVRTPTLRVVIAELRASRIVIDWARREAAEYGTGKFIGGLRAALAELEALK